MSHLKESFISTFNSLPATVKGTTEGKEFVELINKPSLSIEDIARINTIINTLTINDCYIESKNNDNQYKTFMKHINQIFLNPTFSKNFKAIEDKFEEAYFMKYSCITNSYFNNMASIMKVETSNFIPFYKKHHKLNELSSEELIILKNEVQKFIKTFSMLKEDKTHIPHLLVIKHIFRSLFGDKFDDTLQIIEDKSKEKNDLVKEAWEKRNQFI